MFPSYNAQTDATAMATLNAHLEGVGAAVDYSCYTEAAEAALDTVYSHRHAVEDAALNRTTQNVSRWFADFTRDILHNLMEMDASSRDELIQRFHVFVLPIAAGLRVGTNISVDDARLIWQASIDPLDVHLGSRDMGLVAHIRGFRLQTYRALTATTELWLFNTGNLITAIYTLRDTIRLMLEAQPLVVVNRGPGDDDVPGTEPAPYDHVVEDWADVQPFLQLSSEEQSLHDRARRA